MPDVVLTLALYLVIGAAAGVMAGMLGVGGGVVIVPALAWALLARGVTPALVMHVAIGTSLATIVITSLSSIRAHQRRGAILWPVVGRLAPGIVIGTWIGAKIVDQLPAATLKLIFGVFLLSVATQMVFAGQPAAHRGLPGRPALFGVGAVIGAVSGVVGIGGGSLTVPFLGWCNVGIRNAVATSAACGFPIALAGALGFIVTGRDAAGLPPWSLGYINGPAWLGIGCASMLFAPLGARLAHTLPMPLLRRVFALFLGVVGVRMLWP